MATPYINLNKGFEYVLGGGEKMFGSDYRLWEPVSVDLNTLDTFDKFCEQMKSVIANMLKGEMEYVQNWVPIAKQRYEPPMMTPRIDKSNPEDVAARIRQTMAQDTALSIHASPDLSILLTHSLR